MRRLNSACIVAALLGIGALAACSSGPAVLPLSQAAASAARLSGGPWIPAAMDTFAIQYSGKLDTSINADAYDVDGFDTTAATVATLHTLKRHVVCYIDIGTWENWRPDAKTFPKRVLGRKDGHWPGERWLDIRQLSVLEPIMSARFTMCKGKGFDAVDPDNMDGYTNRTGFPLTGSEQLTYDRWVAGAVHRLGLSVDQKNDPGQVSQLRKSFDWAVLEQCATQGWCSRFTPYTRANRLVVDIEYGISKSRFQRDVCPKTKSDGITAILKHLSLDAWVVNCN